MTTVDPARPELADDVLAWAAAIAAHSPTVTILDAEKHLVDALHRQGYTADLDGAFFLALSRDLGDRGAPAWLAPPELPAGFVVRPVRGEPDLARRVAVHQEVWHPSGFTEEHFRAPTTGWPYRPEFDVVVEAPDGQFVAYCLGWYDELNQVGELEPVGTVAEYRRLGLSRAACLAVLRAFRQAGGRTALVYPRGDDDYPIPRQVYAALGFTPHARTVRYRR